MRLVHEVEQLRAQIAEWRSDGRVGFVPTMGNLHAGHLALIDEARRHADRVVSSVFVNPMQFGEGEDFDAYPRTLEADGAKLEQVGTDLLFAPPVEVMYPRPAAEQTRVEVPGLSDLLCGASRPGHFVGVATIVCKLFNLVQPDIAVFGKKDYQQLMVIRRMVEDLDLPIEIVGLDTVREADGLAMSSRNGYLTSEERAQAPLLYQTLRQTAERIVAGETDMEALTGQAEQALRAGGFRPDYFTVRRASDLRDVSAEDRELVILAAAYLGQARLIDNLELIRP
jgi:pantoate--beta-alanine ligase